MLYNVNYHISKMMIHFGKIWPIYWEGSFILAKFDPFIEKGSFIYQRGENGTLFRGTFPIPLVTWVPPPQAFNMLLTQKVLQFYRPLCNPWICYTSICFVRIRRNDKHHRKTLYEFSANWCRQGSLNNHGHRHLPNLTLIISIPFFPLILPWS